MNCRFVFDDGEVFDSVSMPGETLLGVAERAGGAPLADCRAGTCQSCRGHLTRGAVAYAARHDRLLSLVSLAPDEVLCCIAEPGSADVEIAFDYPRVAVRPVRKMVLEVLEILPAADRVVVLRGAIRGRFKLAFTPGQYLEVAIPGTDSRRSYSLANAASTPGEVELHIRLVPAGAMGDWLAHRAQAGDLVDVRGPLGAFHLRRRPAHRIFVTGGTGLAPIMSMLRELVARNDTAGPVGLFHGVTTREDLYGIDELRTLLARFPDHTLHLAMQNADAAWPETRGRVTDLPLDAALRSAPPHSTDVYVCGPPGMIEAVRAIAAATGLRADRVHCEAFIAAGSAGG
jgi:ferredoxin-NADP reductase/ferredoxin